MAEQPVSYTPNLLPIKLAICALLFVAVWVTFGRARNAPFVFDDHYSILRNESIRQLFPPTVPLNPPKFLPFSGRPLVNLSAAINFYLGGHEPWGYRAFDITLHACSAMLLFLISVRALTMYLAPSQPSDRAGVVSIALALAIALIWALHPLQTDAVCYITQRTELMMGFFLLATLYCSLRYWDGGEETQLIWLSIAIAACILGMACKEVMIAAPPIVLLFERTFFRRRFDDMFRTSWQLYAGFGVALLFLFLLNMNQPRSDSAGFYLDVSASTWWMTQCKVLLMYLGLAFWPWPLSIHYEIPYLHNLGNAWPYVLPVALLVLGTLYAIWRNWPLGFVGGWFFMILAPTLIVPIVTEVAAERRMYLPLAAVVVVVVVGGYNLANWLMRRFASDPTLVANRSFPIALAIVLIVTPACVLGAVTWQRLALYQAEELLWRDVLSRYPRSETGHLNLGYSFMNSDDNEGAEREFEKTLEINPESHLAQYNWGEVLDKQGKVAESIPHFAAAAQSVPDNFDYRRMYGVALSKLKQYAAAIAEYNAALKLKPDSQVVHFNLGIALKELGQLPEAARHYAEAVRLSPRDAEVRNNYGNTLRMLKQYPAACRQFEEAIKLDPKLRAARFNFGLTLEAMGRPQDAVGQYEQILAINPADAESHYVLGNVLYGLGRRDDAVVQFQQAVDLDASLLAAWVNMGAALLELGRVDEAISRLEQASTLAPDSPITQFNLAVAYSDAGRKSDSAAQAQKALELAKSQGPENVATQIQAWIDTHPAASISTSDPGK